jgi:hypothetical protein
MTATSAQSATETPSTANSLRDLVASLRTVVVPGSPATYASRAALRAMGLRWDSAGHRSHGTTTMDRVRELRERLGLEVRCFGTLEPPRGPSPPRPPAPALVPSIAPHTDRDCDPVRRLHDGFRTRAEARVACRDSDEDAEEIATPTRRFSVFEVTSGLPDDSREADERAAARQIREIRARVKAARAAISAAPGADKVIRQDWTKAACFYAKFGITEERFRHGVRSDDSLGSGNPEFSYSWRRGSV